MPYPARITVLRSLSPGKFQLRPSEGPKLFQSFGWTSLFGCGESLPTNSVEVSEGLALPQLPAPGVHATAKLPPEHPKSAAAPEPNDDVYRPARPNWSYGTPYLS